MSGLSGYFLNSGFLMRLLTNGARGRLRARVRAKGGHFERSL